MQARTLIPFVIGMLAVRAFAAETARPATQPTSIVAPAANSIQITPATWPAKQSLIKAGDTVILGDGLYRDFVITGKMSGCTFVARNLWGARFTSDDGHAIAIRKGASDVTLDGLDCGRAMLSGIKAEGEVGAQVVRLTIRNCWVHHNGLQGIEGHWTHSLTLIGNLIERNGGGPYHHGVYANGVRHKYTNNIVRWNSGNGVSCGPMQEMTVTENLVQGNGSSGLWIEFAGIGSAGKRSTIERNTVVQNGKYDLYLPGSSDYPSVGVSANIYVAAAISTRVQLTGNVQDGSFVDPSVFDFRSKIPGNPAGVPNDLLPQPSSDWPGGYPCYFDPRGRTSLSLPASALMRLPESARKTFEGATP